MADRAFTVELLLDWINKNQGLVQAMSQGKTLQEQTKGLREDFKKSLAQVGSFFEKGFSGLVNFGKKALVVGGILTTAFVGGAVKISEAGAKLEGYQVTLQQLYGDAKQAGEAMDWIMGLQVKTPYTPDELLGGLKQMKVFGLDAQKWLPAVGDMASTMGMDLVESSRAVSKAWTAGAAGADMLRESFGATMEKLAQVSGYTTKELQGDIGKYREALWAFITDPKFAGGMKRYAATFKGVLSSIKGGFQTFTMFLGREINDVMKQDFQKIVDWIVKMYESGKLEEWAKRVAEGFRMVWQGLKKAGEVVWKFVKPVIDFFKQHPNMLKWAISAVAAGSALTFLGGGLSFIVGKVGQLGIGLVRGIGQIKNFGGAVGKLFTTLRAGGGISGMLAGKGGLLGGVGQIAGGLGGKMSGMGGIAGKIGGLLGGGGAAAGGTGGIVATLSAALPIIGAVIAAAALFATAWKKNFSGIREETKKAFQPLGDIARQLVGLPKSAGSPLKAVGNVFKETWQGLARVAAPVFNFLIKSMTAPFRILKAIATPIIDALKKVLEAFGIVGKGSASGIKTAFEGLGKVFDWLFKGLGKIIDWIVEPIAWGIGKIVEGIQWLTKTLGLNKESISKFGKNLKAEFEGIGKAVKWVVGFIGLVWSKIIQKVVDWFKGLVEKVKGPIQAIGGFFKNLWDGIAKGAAAVWNWIKSKLIDPLTKGFEWLWKNVFKPVADFFGNLFKPLIDGVKAVFRWIGDLLAKAPQWLIKTLGITESDLLKLKGWVSGPMGPQKPAGIPGAAGEPGTETAAPPVPGGETAGAGAGGSSGGGGPSINYWTTHNHYERGSVIINNTGDPAAMKKVLLEIFGQEALATT